MRILHFSTEDTGGGAGKATHRLHSALRDAGHPSRMIVRYKQSDDGDVRQARSWFTSGWPSKLNILKMGIRFFFKGMPHTVYFFNFDRELDLDTQLFFEFEPGDVDIIHLHWITHLLTVKTIRKLYEHYRCPVLWTLTDLGPITGGCHYPFDCEGFKKQCGHCPQLHSDRFADPSQVVWNRKFRSLRNLPITFIAPTSWVATRIKESSLFGDHRIEEIPLSIDTTVFRPFEQRSARDLLHVPQNKKVIFWGSARLDDPRKGMMHLQEALQRLASMVEDKGCGLTKDDLFLLTAGRGGGGLLDSLPFSGKSMEYLRDDVTLALAYQAADVFVCPSTEDAGPMMIPESMLCGTPVVAFNCGGAPDLIQTMKTGYLANYKDSNDLASGIHALISSPHLAAVRNAARDIAVKNHSPQIVVSQYIELYHSLTEESHKKESVKPCF